MPRQSGFGWALAAVLAMGLLGLPTRTEAAFTVRLQSGSQDKLITDQGTTNDSSNIADGDSTVNQIGVMNLSFAGYTISFVGSKTNSPGTATMGRIEISSFSVTNVSAGSNTLTITIFADGFTMPNGGSSPSGFPLILEDQLSITGTSSSFEVKSVSKGQGNGTGGTTGITPDNVRTTTASGSNKYSEFFVGMPIGSATYELTKTLTVSMAQDSERNLTIIGQTTAMVSPAPPAWVLAFSGLLCCGPLAWFRRNRAA